MKSIILSLLILALISSCQQKKEAQAIVTRTYVEEQTKVKTVPVRKETFYKEILNNGKLSAARKAEFTFTQSGEILSLPLVCNEWVKGTSILNA